MYVGGLHGPHLEGGPRAAQEALSAELGKWGGVAKVTLKLFAKNTTGYGFVNFSSQKDAEAAVAYAEALKGAQEEVKAKANGTPDASDGVVAALVVPLVAVDEGAVRGRAAAVDQVIGAVDEGGDHIFVVVVVVFFSPTSPSTTFVSVPSSFSFFFFFVVFFRFFFGGPAFRFNSSSRSRTSEKLYFGGASSNNSFNFGLSTV